MAKSEELYDSYLADEALLPSLAGKAVAITGTTSGLGFALARCAVVKGASLVLLLNRSSERATKSEADLKGYLKDGAGTVVKTIDCDLMKLESVRKAAEKVNEAVKSGGLHVLCLNAGIMAFDDDRTGDGFEVQMQTNMLSHFLLTSLVYPSVKKAAEKDGEARIVSHSSSAREMVKGLEAKYFEKSDANTLGGQSAWFISQMFGKEGPWKRYGQTKLANSAFAMALHVKLKESGSKVKSLACEPGFSVTELQNTKGMAGVMGTLMKVTPKQSAADGSLNACMACFSPKAESGDLYAPKKGLTGKPVKTVAGGVRQKTGWIGATDKTTCDPTQQKLVWEACEKALGIEFVV
ncbi:hypothetical protein ACHAXT_005448 [Thalassiosira profunda]